MRYVLTAKLQYLLPWAEHNRDSSKYFVGLNSFAIHSSKYRRKKGGTEGVS